MLIDINCNLENIAYGITYALITETAYGYNTKRADLDREISTIIVNIQIRGG